MKRFTFTDSAKADLQRIEKVEALGILKALARFGREGVGDVKNSSMTRKGDTGFELEIGECSFASKSTTPYTS